MEKYCRHGHEYTPENSYVHNGVVQCKECRRVNRNKSYHRYNLPVAPEMRWPQHSHCVNGHELTLENTYPKLKNGKKDGRACRQCNRDIANQWRINHPEENRRRKNEWQSQKLYGWSIAERDVFFEEEQGNACAICGRTGLKWGKGYNDTWHTDHEHGKEGTHRGILCASCNMALGKLEPNIIKVIQYLVKYNKTDLIKFLEGLSNGNLNSQNLRHDGLGKEVFVQSSVCDR